MDQLWQNSYLDSLKKTEEQVRVYTTKGIALLGVICQYDDTVIILKHNDELQMIYKHSISCVERFSNNPTKGLYVNRKQRC